MAATYYGTYQSFLPPFVLKVREKVVWFSVITGFYGQSQFYRWACISHHLARRGGNCSHDPTQKNLPASGPDLLHPPQLREPQGAAHCGGSPGGLCRLSLGGAERASPGSGAGRMTHKTPPWGETDLGISVP